MEVGQQGGKAKGATPTGTYFALRQFQWRLSQLAPRRQYHLMCGQRTWY